MPFGVQESHQDDHQAHQGVAGQLDGGRHFAGGLGESEAGSHHLRRIVDGSAHPGAEGGIVHAEIPPQEWIGENRQGAQQGIGGDGEAHLFIFGTDHRTGGGDRRIAANRSANADQAGEPGRHTEQAAEPVRHQQREGHQRDDHADRLAADRRHFAERKPGAEQHDGETQQGAKTETDARPGAFGQLQKIADEQAEGDREDHFAEDLAGGFGEQRVDTVGSGGHQGYTQEAGKKIPHKSQHTALQGKVRGLARRGSAGGALRAPPPHRLRREVSGPSARPSRNWRTRGSAELRNSSTSPMAMILPS